MFHPKPLNPQRLQYQFPPSQHPKHRAIKASFRTTTPQSWCGRNKRNVAPAPVSTTAATTPPQQILILCTKNCSSQTLSNCTSKYLSAVTGPPINAIKITATATVSTVQDKSHSRPQHQEAFKCHSLQRNHSNIFKMWQYSQ